MIDSNNVKILLLSNTSAVNAIFHDNFNTVT